MSVQIEISPMLASLSNCIVLPNFFWGEESGDQQ